MSSHREAPEIAKDPVADSTDVYAFVSPDKPDTVTLIANYIPLEGPAGGPNFYAFGDEVLYEIHVDNNDDARPDVTFQFRFRTALRDPGTFLYNTGPILSLGSANWNSRQFYSVTRISQGHSVVLGSGVSGDGLGRFPGARLAVGDGMTVGVAVTDLRHAVARGLAVIFAQAGQVLEQRAVANHGFPELLGARRISLQVQRRAVALHRTAVVDG